MDLQVIRDIDTRLDPLRRALGDVKTFVEWVVTAEQQLLAITHQVASLEERSEELQRDNEALEAMGVRLREKFESESSVLKADFMMEQNRYDEAKRGMQERLGQLEATIAQTKVLHADCEKEYASRIADLRATEGVIKERTEQARRVLQSLVATV